MSGVGYSCDSFGVSDLMGDRGSMSVGFGRRAAGALSDSLFLSGLPLDTCLFIRVSDVETNIRVTGNFNTHHKTRRAELFVSAINSRRSILHVSNQQFFLPGDHMSPLRH